MGVLRCQQLFFRSFVGSSRATQAVLIFLLISCCLTEEYRAPPFIPNVPFLWGWNIPDENCIDRFNVQLDTNLFSLKGSPRKTATGQAIALFYADRLGHYPYIDEKNGKDVNGGVPQSTDLRKHLEKAKKDIVHYIEEDVAGLGIIDWEYWRPLWVRNWKPKDIYKHHSIELVRQQHSELNDTEISARAKADFEKAGRCIMETTLKLGKELRPRYLWGYYLFPDCYNNVKTDDYTGHCSDEEKERNDELSWLWKESTALFPSIYLSSKVESSPKAALYSRNRIWEAIRVSTVPSAKHPLPVFVYTRPVYTDLNLKYLSEDDLVSTFGESVALGASGIVMWGSLNLSQNVQDCTELDNYMKNKLNPYIINITLAAKMCGQVLCQDQGVCIRKQWDSNDYLHLNPESFAIQLEQSGKYTVQGKPTLEDLQLFSEKFHCACYAEVHCTDRVDMSQIHSVKVCMAGDICIDAFMNSEPGGPLSSSKGKSVTSSNILSAMPPATGFPCDPGKDLRCLKVRLKEANSKTPQVGYQSVYTQNKKQ